MLKVFHSSRALWTLVLAAGDVWAVIAWIWGSGVEILDQLGPAEYATVLFVFTGLIGLVNYSWINGRRPSVRFKGYADDIKDLIFQSTRSNHAPDDPFVAALREELRRKLATLNIVLPDDPEDWKPFLPNLLACARTGHLNDARKLFS